MTIIPPFTNTVTREMPGGRTEYFGFVDFLWHMDKQVYGYASITRTKIEKQLVSHLRFWPPGIAREIEDVITDHIQFTTDETDALFKPGSTALFNLNGTPCVKTKFYFGYRGMIAHNAWEQHRVKLEDKLLEQIFAPIDKQIAGYYHELTKKPLTLEEFNRELQ